MKIAFPHMGYLGIAFMGALRNLGVEVVVPDRSTRQSLARGVPRSPEFVCLPYKMMIGNFIEALELGADTLVTIGGTGPCRLGYYSVVQEQALREAGYEFRIIRTDNPDDLRGILETMREVSGGHSMPSLLGNFYFILRRLDALEEVERLACGVRPYELTPGDACRCLRESVQRIDATRGLWNLRRVRADCRRRFAAIPQDRSRQPVRIGLLGEIFMVLESAANLDIEASLGRKGALVERGVSLASWFNERIRYAPWRPHETRRAARRARGYLDHPCGGESVLSVGKTLEYAERAFDGVVHVMPLGCMPEMVAQTVMGRIGREKGIPILTMVFDEHSAEAGVETRLEAFVDMLHRRRGARGVPAGI